MKKQFPAEERKFFCCCRQENQLAALSRIEPEKNLALAFLGKFFLVQPPLAARPTGASLTVSG